MATEQMRDKRMKKKIQLEDIAFELFTSKGIERTTIDEIVERATMAKGSFYLYYDSKRDLVDHLIMRQASRLLNRAFEEMGAQVADDTDQLDKIIIVVDYILNYFQKNPQFLEFIHKNLYQGLLLDKQSGLIDQALAQVESLDIDSKAFQQKLYLIFELVGSVAYNSIVLRYPYELAQIKATLYRAVKCIVEI